MADKLFGFDHLRVQPAAKEHSFGMPETTAADRLYSAKPKLHATFQNARTQAVSLMEFEDNQEGRTALASQCRVDRLLMLVLGHRVQVESGTKLDFVSGEGPHSDYRRSSPS